MANPNKRAPNGADMFQMTHVGPTGALSPMDTLVSLDDIVDYIIARLRERPPAVELAPDEAAGK